MKGTVEAMGRTNGLLAILTDRGDYTIAAPMSGQVEIGDRIDGPLNRVGRQDLTNLTKRLSFPVVIEDWSCDASRARTLLSK